MDPTKQNTPTVPPTGTAPAQQSGETPGQTPAQQVPPSTPTPAVPNPAPAQTPAETVQPTEPTTTMPTKDFNSRIEQAKRSGVRDLLVALGFKPETVDDPAALTQVQQDLQTTITYAKSQREADMTAEQKLQAQIDDLTTKLTAAESRLKTASDEVAQEREKMLNYRRSNELRRAAETAGARHPEDVLTWAQTNAADKLPTILNEDGTVNQDVIKTVLSDCGKARPEWFRGMQPGSPSNADGRPPSTNQTIQDRAKLAAKNVRDAI